MVDIDLDELITITEPADLGSCSLEELRAVRDRYQEIEHGVSYVRRIVQGRLDTLSAEVERRSEGATENDLITRLPEALATNTRGPGLPRPALALDPPAWTDELLARVDHIVAPSQLASLDQLDVDELASALAAAVSSERSLSTTRQELHRRADRVQGALVERYRGGASVDDLLQ